MGSTQIDRITGLSSSAAIKVPVRVASAGVDFSTYLTSGGLPTMDGVQLDALDRVLLKDQSDNIQNGIYIASTSPWIRAQDFQNNSDLCQGTLVYVAEGAADGGQLFQLTSPNPVNVGVLGITFAETSTSQSATAITYENPVVSPQFSQTVAKRLAKEIWIDDWGGVGDGATDNDVVFTAIAAYARSVNGNFTLHGTGTYYVSGDSGIYDFSGCSNLRFAPGFTIKGPSGQALFKFWGSLGTPVSYGSAIAIGASSFTLANDFSAGQMLLLSNFPTDSGGSDAYTTLTPDVFGRVPRSYATTGTANLRQTRRMELVIVQSATATAFVLAGGVRYAYTSTTSLQFTPVSDVKNISLECDWINCNVQFDLARDVTIPCRTAFATYFGFWRSHSPTVECEDFDAGGAINQVAFTQACFKPKARGRYRGLIVGTDNGIVIAAQSIDPDVDAHVYGTSGSPSGHAHGVHIDTNYEESPLGYTDIDNTNPRVIVVAHSIGGNALFISCDPYAASIDNGDFEVIGTNVNVQVVGATNPKLRLRLGEGTGAITYPSNLSLYGVVNPLLEGRYGAIFATTAANPRNGSQTTATSGVIQRPVPSPDWSMHVASTGLASETGDGTGFTVPFDTADLDPAAQCNTTTGIITAAISGSFAISASVELTGLGSGHTSGSLEIVTTGQIFFIDGGNPGAARDASNDLTLGGSAIVYLNAGNTAKIVVSVSGSTKTVGVGGNASSLVSVFSGRLVQ